MTQPALLLIDVQQGLDDPSWGQRNNLEAEANILSLLEYWRANNLPVIHVQHMSQRNTSPLHPDAPGNALKPETAPAGNERLFTKTVNSAFIGTGLEDYLREQGLKDLVIVGLTTDHCVSTTTRMAGNLGFEVKLVSDATATFERRDANGKQISADDMHRVNLASLHGEFCTVVTTDEALDHIATQFRA